MEFFELMMERVESYRKKVMKELYYLITTILIFGVIVIFVNEVVYFLIFTLIFFLFKLITLTHLNKIIQYSSTYKTNKEDGLKRLKKASKVHYLFKEAYHALFYSDTFNDRMVIGEIPIIYNFNMNQALTLDETIMSYDLNSEEHLDYIKMFHHQEVIDLLTQMGIDYKTPYYIDMTDSDYELVFKSTGFIITNKEDYFVETTFNDTIHVSMYKIYGDDVPSFMITFTYQVAGNL